MMVRSSSHIVLFLLWFLCGAKLGLSLSKNRSQIRCNRRDQEILLQFKEDVVDPSSLLSSWSNEKDCCKWVGVQCHSITGRVVGLDLHYYGISLNSKESEPLTGEINLCVFQLDFLKYLYLSDNNFTVIHGSTNDGQRYYNSSLTAPQCHNANNSTFISLDLSGNSHLMIDSWRWLCHIPSLKYLTLNYINLSRESDVLQSISTQLPSLLELSLAGCQLHSVSQSAVNVNFTSLTALDLFNNNFNSKVLEWVFNISDSLSYLDLDENYIDRITDTLLNLQNLKYLFLGFNKLKGTIPNWLAQYKNLQMLDLSYNSFHGSIPLVLGNLSSLIYLNVGENSLGGVLSESIFTNLKNLRVLNLRSSAFLFNVSSDWTPPFQLTQIHLKSCILGPKFPTWLYTQRFLKVLDISSSGISFVDHDKFWSFVSNVTEHLGISNNSISGDISNLVLNQRSIHLTANKFYGGLPRLTPNMVNFIAGNNSFTGTISPFLCGTGNAEQCNLRFLDLSDNHLSGELPDCWMNCKYLISINLGSNNLLGRIAPSIGTLFYLSALYLYDNNFLGDMPLSLQQCYQLEFLILDGNQLSGNIPSWMPQSIIAVNLRGNKISGNIPPEICQLSSLIFLDLADNRLSGSIPQCLYNLSAMENGSAFSISYFITPIYYYMSPYSFMFHTKGQQLEYRIKHLNLWRLVDLSKNHLVESIPPELFRLVGLTSLNLSQNQLTGKIPPEIGQMINLESLDLSGNRLFGEIPQAMASLSFLENLNLSFNNFIGRIPTGTQLQSFNASSYVGNLELCGAPLKNCTQEDKSVDIVNANDEDEFLSWFYIGIGIGFAMGFWGVFAVLSFKRSWRHAYFKFVDDIKDQFYLKVLLIMNSISS